jgi:hypothetical protein
MFYFTYPDSELKFERYVSTSFAFWRTCFETQVKVCMGVVNSFKTFVVKFAVMSGNIMGQIYRLFPFLLLRCEL